ncbi:hypothetical protein WN944_012167 [Citrus x changshan-huyou]|uniref:Uncharacterized protein n=1 Tax=Citrus x changshan-huyou TaxID=2935761 RepID=A0AAP0QZE4_9ROSI
MDITVLESFPTSQSGLFSHLTTIVESADKPSLNLSRPSDASPFAAADAQKNLKSKRARPRMLALNCCSSYGCENAFVHLVEKKRQQRQLLLMNSTTRLSDNVASPTAKIEREDVIFFELMSCSVVGK